MYLLISTKLKLVYFIVFGFCSAYTNEERYNGRSLHLINPKPQSSSKSFPPFFHKTPQKCPQHCSSCSKSNGCISCDNRHHLNFVWVGVKQVGTCVSTCPDGFYAKFWRSKHESGKRKKLRDYSHASRCTKCASTYCRKCSTGTRCTSCYYPSFLYNGKCVLGCPLSHKTDEARKKCVRVNGRRKMWKCEFTPWSEWSPCEIYKRTPALYTHMEDFDRLINASSCDDNHWKDNEVLDYDCLSLQMRKRSSYRQQVYPERYPWSKTYISTYEKGSVKNEHHKHHHMTLLRGKSLSRNNRGRNKLLSQRSENPKIITKRLYGRSDVEKSNRGRLKKLFGREKGTKESKRFKFKNNNKHNTLVNEQNQNNKKKKTNKGRNFKNNNNNKTKKKKNRICSHSEIQYRFCESVNYKEFD